MSLGTGILCLRTRIFTKKNRFMSALTYYAGQMPDTSFNPHQPAVFDETKLVMLEKMNKLNRVLTGQKNKSKPKTSKR